jgi:hypothetical protein
MTAVAHLLPENVAEGLVAVQIVVAQTYARDALRQASHGTPGATADPDKIRQCRAWAASMMRQADSGIRTLLRMQAERHKAEDAMRPAAMERAGYWFRSVSPPEPAHAAEPAPAPAPEPAAPARPPLPLQKEPAPDVIQAGVGSGLAPTPSLEYGAMTPAERFVTLYPDRAASILAAGGLPARLAFPPPDPELIAELLDSNSPVVRAFRQANRPVAV